MDTLSSVIAALDAGKLPNQQQADAAIDWILQNIVARVESSDAGNLSEPGKALAYGIQDLLIAYKTLGNNKNYDNLLQDVLWHLSEGDFADTRVEAIDTEEASADLQSIRSAIRTLLQILWTNVSGEGSVLLDDFASFARLAMADLAGVIETGSAYAKESLREFDTKVQQGERDNLGRKRQTPEELEQKREEDTKKKFEQTMDTAKEAGSKAIGVGQDVKASAEEMVERTRARLQETYYNICERAQKDKEYRRALSTLFDTVSKWINKSLDTAADINQSTSLESSIDDPSEEKHILEALCGIRTLVERAAGGKSLDDVFAQFRLCAVHVRNDKDLKRWFNDFFAHVRKSLDEPGYARSEEAQQVHRRLGERWKQLLDQDSVAGRKWKEDVRVLREQLRAFQHAVTSDVDLQRMRKAHVAFGRDLAQSIGMAGQTGMQFALDHASWFWQDVFNVYVPRILRVIKNIPIPRTEFVDNEIEFVLENLNVSSLSLLPGHVYIRNITDVDITAPAGSQSTTTAFGTLTHIRMQAVQLALKEVSFFYRDKLATVGPKEFTGLMEFILPPKGIDIDLKFRLIPNTPEGLKERERLGRFFKIERIEVTLAEDIDLEIKQSNHPILTSVFKPVFMLRFRDAISRTLEEQIRGLFDTADALAFDIGRRSEVFQDAGLGTSSSVVAAMWSEIGKLRRMEGGLLSGWRATGTGIVKDDLGGNAKIAMGAEPQILSGEKRGPLGTHAEPLAERIPGADVGGALEGAKTTVERVERAGREGLKQVQSFKQSVEHKKLEEEKRRGWKSPAFDL
ncbi:hypothetical protein DEU56DRAFT_743663 [Suillus clintonianus]|uniref:uncharacterized protein n=1 Tax=Suillus clintonianus TaxID=1904413 RepID=UPI001B862244|nr:uncharacterized protein DEU56DRAFT_743663 [Suillus clintonianus]KAG2125484.1 hypothetical protein DEU56DRAFT_743663 [Suillus clintonianus]